MRRDAALALAALGIVAMLDTMDLGVRTLTTFEDVSPSPLGEGRGEGRVSAPVTTIASVVAPRSTSPSPLGEGRGEGRVSAPTITPPPHARIPANLPATLELVALPPAPGAQAPTPKAVSRAQAVASVIGSQEFQETVSPLARLYFATFGRYPDYEGLNHYTGQREEARPLPEIATEFAGSREFEMRYGELDNAEFVARIMANVLGHESQAEVRGYWTAELDSGRLTRGQVIVDLAESGMFRERTAPEVFVANAYIEILRRTPDPAGFERWLAHLRNGGTYSSVIDGLLAGR